MTIRTLEEGDSTPLTTLHQTASGGTLPPASPADHLSTPAIRNNEESKSQLPTDPSSRDAVTDPATEAGNDISNHRYMGMKIDSSSQVFNGDLMKGQQPAPSQQHIITGGSVNKGSLLINGDTDRKSLDRLLGGKGSD